MSPMVQTVRQSEGVCGNFISFDLARSYIRAGINKLVDSCLLFHYEGERHVRMHDLVRDVALKIASRSEDRKILVNFSKDLNTLEENGAVKDYFAVSSWYTKTDLISHLLDAPKLQIFLLETKEENSLDFWFSSSEGVKELKVMSILNSYYYDPQSLLSLQSTQWLTNLRTLHLNRWNLGDLSFLVDLTRLETLDLRWCQFRKLPKGMGKLNKLKLLDLSECIISDNFNYEAIGSCLQLEELYAFGYNQGCPSQHMEDIVALPKLRRFVIQLGWFKTIYYEECIRVLHLLELNISNLGASKQNLLQRAEDVCLERLRGGCKNIIPDMVQVVGGMKDLTNLGFRSCSEIECLIDTTYHHAGSFQVDALLPKLVKLELSEMDNLQEVCRGPPLLVLGFFEKLEQLFIRMCKQLHSIFPEACNLCNLKILKIAYSRLKTRNCSSSYTHKLSSVFSMSVAQSLQQLEELSIEGCKELKHIITSEGEGGTNIGDNSQVMFPNLKKLLVSFCPKLEFIFPISFALQGLLQLQEIEISHASGLNYVFFQHDHEAYSSHQNQIQIMLAHLKVFKLYNLENLLGICPENYHLRYPSTVEVSCWGCPKLTTSFINAVVSSAQRQQHLSRGVELDEDEKNHLTSNLQLLELQELPQLKSVWSDSTPRQVLSFQFLQLLELDRCANLKTVFSMAIERSLPTLTSLSILHCEELEEIMAENEEPRNQSDTEMCFPKLSELVIKECNKLKSLFSVSMPPQLTTLHISKAAQLEVVFRYGSEGNIDNEDQIMLPNLRNLELKKLPSFVNIFQGFNFRAPKLEELSTNECPKFGPIFRGNQVISFHHKTEQRQVVCLIAATWSELCEQRLSAALEAFLNLKVLHETKGRAQGIFHLQVKGEISSSTEGKPLYSNLRDLELCDLPDLRFIWKSFPKFMSLEKLEWISLVECPKLKTVFSPDIVRCLPKLKRLLISNCDELEEIISSDLENAQLRHSTTWPQQQVYCFPQLFDIEVNQCSKLKCLFYGFKACHFPMLHYLKIENCSQLEQAFEFKIEVGDKSFQREVSEDEHLILFPKLHLIVVDCLKYSLTSSEWRTSCSHIATQKGQIFWLITVSSDLQDFLNLKGLRLTKSRAEGIFQLQFDGELDSNIDGKPLNLDLENLWLSDLPELRFILKGFSKLLLSLEKLRAVSLVECPKLKIIFSPDIIRCLPKLERLLLSNCEELEEIISPNSENAQIRHQQELCFPQLIKIEVKQCNKLKCLFYNSMAYHFPKLKSLEIEECSQLEQVFGFKGKVDNESFLRRADDDGNPILFPKLKKLVLKSLPIFFEIFGGFNLQQPMRKYLVIDCPKYSSTFAEVSTPYQHTITQGEYSSEKSSDGEYSDEESSDGA